MDVARTNTWPGRIGFIMNKKIQVQVLLLLSFVVIGIFVHKDQIPPLLSYSVGIWMSAWAIWIYQYTTVNQRILEIKKKDIRRGP